MRAIYRRARRLARTKPGLAEQSSVEIAAAELCGRGDRQGNWIPALALRDAAHARHQLQLSQGADTRFKLDHARYCAEARICNVPRLP